MTTFNFRSLYLSVRYYIAGLYHRVDEHHLFLLAGGLAFSLFVCVIPLVLIVFAVAGVILEQPTIRSEIELLIDQMVPLPEHAAYVKDLVCTRVEEFRAFKSVAGIIGGAGILIAATGLFSSLRTILNSVFKVRKQETILFGKLRDLGFIVILLVLFTVATVSLTAIDVVGGAAQSWTRIGSETQEMLGGLGGLAISAVVVFVLFAMVYFMVPLQRPGWKVILISAVTATILWHLAGVMFELYVSHFVTLKRIYGTYALLLAVVFWIYYTAVVFILGAETGQLYRERQGILEPKR